VAIASSRATTSGAPPCPAWRRPGPRRRPACRRASCRTGRLVCRVSRDQAARRERSTSWERPIVNSLTIAGIVFACTFGGALLGMFLRRILPVLPSSFERFARWQKLLQIGLRMNRVTM
jgi:hypothetical protein